MISFTLAQFATVAGLLVSLITLLTVVTRFSNTVDRLTVAVGEMRQQIKDSEIEQKNLWRQVNKQATNLAVITSQYDSIQKDLQIIRKNTKVNKSEIE